MLNVAELLVGVKEKAIFMEPVITIALAHKIPELENKILLIN